MRSYDDWKTTEPNLDALGPVSEHVCPLCYGKGWGLTWVCQECEGTGIAVPVVDEDEDLED